MDLFTKLFGDFLVFVYHCFDRIVIRGYLTALSRPELVVHFFREIVGVAEVSKGGSGHDCAPFGQRGRASPGNAILRAETGGLFQAQNAGEQSEFGSQTTLRLTNPPELRGFLSTRKPPKTDARRNRSRFCLTRPSSVGRTALSRLYQSRPVSAARATNSAR